jgi:hypothetical protein
MPGNNDKNRNLTLRRKKMKLSILLAGSILTSALKRPKPVSALTLTAAAITAGALSLL